MFKFINRYKTKVKKWSDYDRVTESVSGWKAVLAKLLVPRTPQRYESFEQAVKRLKLKPADIQKRMRTLKRLTLLMLVIGLAILGYTFYNLIYTHWIASILSFILFILTLVLAFRYHFWYCQMQHRILGMSFWQWFRIGLLKQSYKKNSEVKDLEVK